MLEWQQLLGEWTRSSFGVHVLTVEINIDSQKGKRVTTAKTIKEARIVANAINHLNRIEQRSDDGNEEQLDDDAMDENNEAIHTAKDIAQQTHQDVFLTTARQYLLHPYASVHGALKYPFNCKENEPSPKMKKAIQICKDIIEQDKGKPLKDQRKILISLNWSGLLDVLFYVSCFSGFTARLVAEHPSRIAAILAGWVIIRRYHVFHTCRCSTPDRIGRAKGRESFCDDIFPHFRFELVERISKDIENLGYFQSRLCRCRSSAGKHLDRACE